MVLVGDLDLTEDFLELSVQLLLVDEDVERESVEDVPRVRPEHSNVMRVDAYPSEG